MEQELLVPRAGWLLLEHAQPLGEAFSNAVQPTHTQATAHGVLCHGESDALSFPSLPAAELGWHLGTRLLIVTSDICGARVRSRVKMPLLQKGMLQGLQGSNPKARFVSLWSITTCAVLQYHRGLADATVSSFPKWEHTAAFIILPLTRKICAEVDGPGHIRLLCGTIPGAALLSLRVPSLKGAIQPRSK